MSKIFVCVICRTEWKNGKNRKIINLKNKKTVLKLWLIFMEIYIRLFYVVFSGFLKKKRRKWNLRKKNTFFSFFFFLWAQWVTTSKKNRFVNICFSLKKKIFLKSLWISMLQSKNISKTCSKFYFISIAKRSMVFVTRIFEFLQKPFGIFYVTFWTLKVLYSYILCTYKKNIFICVYVSDFKPRWLIWKGSFIWYFWF